MRYSRKYTESVLKGGWISKPSWVPRKIWSNDADADLDGKCLQLHSHMPWHAILKTNVWFVECLKHCIVCFPIRLFSSL